MRINTLLLYLLYAFYYITEFSKQHTTMAPSTPIKFIVDLDSFNDKYPYNCTIHFKSLGSFMSDAVDSWVYETGTIDKSWGEYNERELNVLPINATRNLNLKHMISFTISLEYLSTLVNNIENFSKFQHILIKALSKGEDSFVNNINKEFLGVFEVAPLRGFHLHLIIIDNIKFTKEAIEQIECIDGFKLEKQKIVHKEVRN